MKLKKQARKLDKLHLEYESLLLQEIQSLIGVAVLHGWQSRLYAAGFRAREALRKAGSKIAPEET